MIRYKKDTDNIVTLTLDMGTRNINIINHKVGKAFLPVIDHLKKEKSLGQLRGIIITSAKKTFLSGGDLEYLHELKKAEEIFQVSGVLKSLFRDLEEPGVPVVAAINGTALGSGFELALACHHRIVVNNPRIRLGFPEVNLGLMPGSGGTIRLLWLLGLEKAFNILSAGKRYAPKEALEVGIIDDLADDVPNMLEKARQWLLEPQERRRIWDMADGQINGGTLKDIPVRKTVQQLAAQLTKDTFNNFPAPQVILNTLADGSLVDFDTALQLESRNFTQLVLGKNIKKYDQSILV